MNEQVLVQQPTWRIIQRGIIINGHASNYMHLAKFLIFRNWVLTEVDNYSLAVIAGDEKDHAPMVFNRVLLPKGTQNPAIGHPHDGRDARVPDTRVASIHVSVFANDSTC